MRVLGLLHTLTPMGFGTREFLVSSLSLAWAVPVVPAEAPAQRAPTFRSSAAEVRIEVAAIDDHGRAVEGLVAGDFEVRDCGQRQEISSFLRFESTGDWESGHEPQTHGRRGVLFLLIDDFFLSPREVVSVTRAVEGFLASLDATAEVWLWAPEAGILQWGHAGTDAAHLRTAARAIRASPDRLSFMRDPEMGNPALLRDLWWRRIEAIERAFGMVQPKSRPTQLVLISRGIGYVREDGSGRLAYDRIMQAAKRSEAPLIWIDASPLGTVGPRAVWERSAISDLDARRMETESTAPASLGQARIGARLRLAARSGGSLTEAVARDSGGYAHRGELKAAFTALSTLSHANYLVGFVSHAPADDGRFHSLRVKVRRRGVTAHSRPGYWAPTGSSP